MIFFMMFSRTKIIPHFPGGFQKSGILFRNKAHKKNNRRRVTGISRIIFGVQHGFDTKEHFFGGSLRPTHLIYHILSSNSINRQIFTSLCSLQHCRGVSEEGMKTFRFTAGTLPTDSAVPCEEMPEDSCLIRDWRI